ncbi:P1 family peptidase [Tissierella simiarum]
MVNKKIRDYGITIGNMPIGKNNSLTDVPGVKVGHVTLDKDSIKTGVTAILPYDKNLFREKLICACHVINGFGKSTGLVQIEELGTIETPIILTNTLSVGTAYEALVKYMLNTNEDIGKTTGTVNPIICECNDGYLNDIRGLHIKDKHIFEAIKNADCTFEEGNVGAGTGMVCYGLKGGIGSSSRVINLDNKNYNLGVLVLSNFGLLDDFILHNQHIGPKIKDIIKSTKETEEKGSIITIVATDIPLSYRQLKRVIKRAYSGISKTGSFTGNGSGEIVIGFSTANIIRHYEEKDILDIKVINENKIDQIFKAVSEATEESILNSLICSNTTIGRDGHKIYSLKDFINRILPY